MRDAFVKKLTEKAADDPSVMLLVGDLGFGVVADFGEAYPKQFLNCGVAEQSMVGIAAGMASAGRRPFVYSIANFPTLRPLEQIRNDVCYHGLGVTIVSVGAGLAYGSLGLHAPRGRGHLHPPVAARACACTRRPMPWSAGPPSTRSWPTPRPPTSAWARTRSRSCTRSRRTCRRAHPSSSVTGRT